MTKAVILLEEGAQDEEFIYAYHRMIEEGWDVDVATPSVRKKYGETVTGLPKIVCGKFGVPLKVTRATEELREPDYDLVVIPGGFVSPDMLRMRPEVLRFVGAMFGAGKLVAAICHGPWVTISAGIMKGFAATCYASLKDDLINAGAIYLDVPVVVDRNLITAPHYKNNGDFMREVVKFMREKTIQEGLARAYANAP